MLTHELKQTGSALYLWLLLFILLHLTLQIEWWRALAGALAIMTAGNTWIAIYLRAVEEGIRRRNLARIFPKLGVDQ